MLSGKREYDFVEVSEAVWQVEPLSQPEDTTFNPPTRFHSRFADCMKMSAPTETVAAYFAAHQEWFCRCAQPMKVEPLGKNGYALAIGRFGSFGYDVEPKIGLELLPADRSVYQIKTIAVPDYVAPGYDVDFQAVMHLISASTDCLDRDCQIVPPLTSEITRVEWQLDLTVDLKFPRFIQRLPKSLVQTTGDRLLNQIVRQVSRRLTYKVQEDFHQSLGLPLPDQPQRPKRKC